MYSPGPETFDSVAVNLDRHTDAVGTWLGGVGTIQVTIYLSDGDNNAHVEQAVEELLATAGLRITDRAEPVIDSWFRRMTARAQQAFSLRWRRRPRSPAFTPPTRVWCSRRMPR